MRWAEKCDGLTKEYIEENMHYLISNAWLKDRKDT